MAKDAAARLAAKIRGALDHAPRPETRRVFDPNEDGTVDVHPAQVSKAVRDGHLVLFTRETVEQMLAFLEGK